MNDGASIWARVDVAVAKSLRAITTAEGYHTDSAAVAAAVVIHTTAAPHDVAGSTPRTGVVDAQHQVVAHDVDVSIVCRVSGPRGADSVRRVLDLVADIRRRLAEDRSLDGSVLEMYEMDSDESDDAMVRGDGSARLVYRARVVTLADAVEEKTP